MHAFVKHIFIVHNYCVTRLKKHATTCRECDHRHLLECMTTFTNDALAELDAAPTDKLGLLPRSKAAVAEFLLNDIAVTGEYPPAYVERALAALDAGGMN